MTTRVGGARRELTQYTNVDSELHVLAVQLHDGLITETDARWDAAAMLTQCGLVERTVSRWLTRQGPRNRHLFDDLVLLATGWVMREVTGHAVGDYQSELRIPAAEIVAGGAGGRLDFRRLLDRGSSGVGYIRNGLNYEMGHFVRTMRSRTSTGRDLMYDPTLVNESTDNGSSSGGGGNEYGPESGASRLIANRVAALPQTDSSPYPGELRAAVIIDDHAHRTHGASQSRRRDVAGQALRSYYELPELHRPLSRARRLHMLEVVEHNPSSALESARMTRNHQEEGDRFGLVSLWRDFDETHLDAILTSARPQESAHALALAALAQRTRPNAETVTRFRTAAAASFKEHDLSQDEGRRLADAFITDEYEERSGWDNTRRKPTRMVPNPQRVEWTTLAQPHVRNRPSPLQPTLAATRTLLFDLVGSSSHGRRSPARRPRPEV